MSTSPQTPEVPPNFQLIILIEYTVELWSRKQWGGGLKDSTGEFKEWNHESARAGIFTFWDTDVHFIRFFSGSLVLKQKVVKY